MLWLFKSKIFVFTLIIFIILISIGISSKKDSKLHFIGDIISVPLAPMQSLFSYIGQQVQKGITFFNDTKSLKKENKDLKAELDKLKNVVRKQLRYEEENKRLKAALNLKNKFNDYASIGGNIISKDLGNWFNVFTIDRGSGDGIEIDSPVITSQGLVGRLYESLPFTSKVLSIIDIDSTVSAIVKSTDSVLVKGDLKLRNQGFCKMEDISPELDLEVGDTVETSGMGGIYPQGILIGKVRQIINSNNEYSRYAIIEPAVDFKRLQEVFVLKSKMKK